MVKTVHNQGYWNLNCIFFILPPDPHCIITNSYFPLPKSNHENKLIWDNSPNGKFTLNNTYMIFEANNTQLQPDPDVNNL